MNRNSQIIKRYFPIYLLLFSFCFAGTAQAEKSEKLFLKGYVKYLHTVYIPENSDLWLIGNLLHNRVDLRWFPSDLFTLVAGLRTRFAYGDFVKYDPGYEDNLRKNPGYFTLSTILFKGKSYVLHAGFDRLYGNFTSDKWNIKLGRHRINWGMNLVWNPNDWFNTFSYLDFDYEERPGTDGISVHYYTGAASSLETAFKIFDDIDEVAIAARYVFNARGFDFQFLCGMAQTDFAIGAGWSGQILGGAFRGEISYFHPKNNFTDTTGTCVASISGDYTFPNQIYLQISTLVNSSGKTKNASIHPLTTIPADQNSVKYLTPALIDLFAQISYPFTPLINGNLSCIFNPADLSGIVNPMLSVSLTDNIDVSFIGQIFWGKQNTEYGKKGALLFGRLRWSF